jgi:urease accessory protein
MLRATTVIRKPAVKADRVADTVTLDHEGRHRRRVALTGDNGLEFLLDLDKATILGDGDAVKLEDGRLVQVKAAPQRLLEIKAENPLRLLKVAYHVGNRHSPAEVTADAIYIEEDHVLAEMVRGQGCTATLVMRAFQPERGAYEHDCGHDHGHHDHGHDHD